MKILQDYSNRFSHLTCCSFSLLLLQHNPLNIKSHTSSLENQLARVINFVIRSYNEAMTIYDLNMITVRFSLFRSIYTVVAVHLFGEVLLLFSDPQSFLLILS